MPVQISITRGGQAMTLQCPEEEWERVRKRFNTSPDSDEVLWVTGTDDEHMGLRISDILCVIYIDDETFKEMKRREREKRQRQMTRQQLAQKRGLSVEPGEAH